MTPVVLGVRLMELLKLLVVLMAHKLMMLVVLLVVLLMGVHLLRWLHLLLSFQLGQLRWNHGSKWILLVLVVGHLGSRWCFCLRFKSLKLLKRVHVKRL
jgi:hypothetical protein